MHELSRCVCGCSLLSYLQQPVAKFVWAKRTGQCIFTIAMAVSGCAGQQRARASRKAHTCSETAAPSLPAPSRRPWPTL
eukprot:353915-Chlamydomonas_euryale.AAC.1